MKEETLIREINRFTAFWYEYVSEDHHKDHDCHWSVEQRWSYGQVPQWISHHYGYIYEGGEIKTKTYMEALKAIKRLIKEAIDLERSWAKQVLSEPKKYDRIQRKKAKLILSFSTK